MMQTCYGRDWSCAESMAAATHDLLQVSRRLFPSCLEAYTSTIVLKDSCKSTDPIGLAVCESEAFTLSNKLSVAAGYMKRSAEVCSSSCNLAKPQ